MQLTTKLVEVFQLGDERAGLLDLPAKYWPSPGQYLPCQQRTGELGYPTRHLYRVFSPEDGLCMAPLPEEWKPGDWLTCLSPQGTGFFLPREARRIGLIAYKVSPARVLALIDRSLAQHAAVALFSDPAPHADFLNRLPSMVEASPLSTLKEDPTWPDYLAVDIQLQDLEGLPQALGASDLPFTGQVLVRTDMPCRGLAKCGVCAVKTHHGWRHACMDGPVFSMEVVLNVVQ